MCGGEIGFQTGTKEEQDKNAAIIAKEAEEIARKVICQIGYDDDALLFNGNNCEFLNKLHAQSSDINQGVVGKGLDEYEGQQGAGDQGMMFGFACNETPELMPAPVMYSHQLLLKATELRKSKKISWLRPDAKSQVTIEYEGHKPVRIDAVVISHQHDPKVSQEEIRKTVIEQIINPVLEPTGLLDSNTKIYVNPTGKFEIGGPNGDSGLTGRKIIVDTYGGMGRHGGGAFSGKDPSKVDRSAAYMLRHIAKNIVANGYAKKCEIQVAYAIGMEQPMSVFVDTFGTNHVDNDVILSAVKENFDLTPAGIIKRLDLTTPRYSKLASHGHFGRLDLDLPWERLDKIENILKLK